MNGKRDMWRLFMGIAGSIVLMIGLAHTIMPSVGYDPSVAASLSSQTRAHFYDLGTYAIASFLIAFGVLSLILSVRGRARDAAVFAAVMSVVWAVRFVLELRFPVDLRLFFVEDPHVGLAVVVAVVASLYAASTVRIVQLRRRGLVPAHDPGRP